MQLHHLANDNALLQLDTSLRQFNMFEAVGAVRQELRHSDFLAFLLNPYTNHGLKGRFTGILLAEIAKSNKGKAYLGRLPIKREILNNAEVRREWRNIDILLRCTANRFVLIIENKIDSPEKDGQLKKYWETVVEEFPGWKARGIYLTPDAEEPGNSNYISVGYELVSRSLERILKDHSCKLSNDFTVAVRHYNAMIKHKITRQLEDECWNIYTKHQYAFDLIRGYVDRSDPTRRYLKELIQKSPTLECHHDRPGYVQFRPLQWEKTAFLNSKCALKDILFFEFQYGDTRRAAGSLVLLLVISNDHKGKEPAEAFNRAKQNCPPFRVRGPLTKYSVIFSTELLSKGDMDNLGPSARQKIKRRWNDFINQTLPSLCKAIQKHFTV